jgi:phosphoesterase RecJ-like protein
LDDSFLDLLREERRFLLTGHEHPDGDCLGAQVALYHLLRQIGKQVTICNPDPLPRMLDFLASDTPIESCRNGTIREFDVLVLVDCAELHRIGRVREAVERFKPRIAVIDHHVGSEHGAGEVAWVDSAAPATGALVHELYLRLGQPLGRAAARGVFVSLVSDTGWFRHSNTDARVFELAARLADAGVDTADLFDRMFRRNDRDSVKLLAESLAGSELACDGRFAFVCLDRASVEWAGRIGFDMDLILEPLRSIDGIEVVALFKELNDGGVKVSLRATRDIDVQAIARSFGGGGHRKAAGASLSEPMEAARLAILERIKAALRAAEDNGGSS